MKPAPALVWIRRDLRLEDHPALLAAVERGGPIIPLFIHDNADSDPWGIGAASRWWLHHSLERLAADLQACGSRLILRRGKPAKVLREVAREAKAGALFWNRCYEPAALRDDAELKRRLEADGLTVEMFRGNLLFEPWDVQTGQGKPYQVFTPFWKSCRARGAPDAPRPAPSRLAAPSSWPKSDQLKSLGLLPKIDWAAGLRDTWQPGPSGALAQLERFVEAGLDDYAEGRNLPACEGSSRLSPHLHFGEISVRRVWQALDEHASRTRASSKRKSIETYRAELGWREFAHHVLYHFPETTDRPLRTAFESFPWEDDAPALAAWQKGRTGFPLVDAGMRELWTTGWMHNRVRMIVASFLTKDLRISWRQGACWFWDTLVDADLANNTLGWQWTAGCGADAAPFFRVFNPTSQGRKFDPDGGYVRRWVPELAELPDRWIHEPAAAPRQVLAEAGVRLGETYPHPIVDHAQARTDALSLYKAHVGGRPKKRR